MCVVPETPPSHAVISLVLQNDAVLKDALSLKPVLLRTVNATLPPGIIVDPPNSIISMKNGRPQTIPPGVTKMVTSNITWSTFPTDRISKNEVTSNPRYHICLVTMIKPFSEALQPWISYHRSVGVDKVFILDNNANHSLADDFESRQDVEVIHWPFDRSQVQGLTFILHASRARCDWLLAADVDEYLMLGMEDAGPMRPLEWYLKAKASENEVMSQFGYIDISGNRSTAAEDPMPLAYTFKGKQRRPWQGKSACRTNNEWRLHNIHGCAPRGIGIRSTPYESGLDRPVRTNNPPKIIHYFLRSWEEYKEKQAIGSASVMDWRNNPSENSWGEMPKWFTELTAGAEEWTHFKDAYQVVMKLYSENEQSLVWQENDRRCEYKKNSLAGSEERAVCLTDT